jgi:uncharacterized delta-60 repeat protein
MLKRLLLLGLSLLAVPALPQPTTAQTLDPTFTPPTSLYGTGTVFSMAAQQADGKRVVVGSFTRVNNVPVAGLARLDAAGTLDTDFTQKVGTVRNVRQVKTLPNGQYLVSGASTEAVTAGGLTRPALLRLNANGTADAAFDAGTGPVSGYGAQLNTFVGQPDGKVLVGGAFTSFSGQYTSGLVRLTPTGDPDFLFNAVLGRGFDKQVNAIVVQPDGKILVGGTFTTFNGQPTDPLLRLNADGTLDRTFLSGLPFPYSNTVTSLLVQPDGKILVTGALGTTGIVRLTANGYPDTSFTAPTYPNGYAVGNLDTSVQLQPDGKIIFFGTFNPYGNAAESIVRLNPDGSLDSSFTAGSNGAANSVYTLGLQRDGSLWIGGNFDSLNNREAALGRLTSTGAIDAAFTPKIQNPGVVTALARQADGRLLVGGYFSEFSGAPVHHLVRLSATGTLDAAFAAAAQPTLGQVTALALQADGKVLVGTDHGVQRLLPDGSTDASYSTITAGNSIYRLVVQPDGKVLAAGDFYNIAGTSFGHLIRLSATGDYDSSFSIGTANGPGTINYPSALALQRDGKVLVAGFFFSNLNNFAVRVVRYNSNGTVDPFFDSSTAFGFPGNATGVATSLNSLVVQPDGNVLVGGYFATVNGTPRTNLARLTTTGQLDATFVPTTLTTDPVTAVALQPDGRVLVSSGYGSYVGAAAPAPTSLVRLLPTGASDPSFGAAAILDDAVTTLLVQPNGAVVAGGVFTTINGQASAGLARLAAPTPLAAAAPTAATTLSVWPVPAHGLLHVALAADAQAAELLDALGRVVRQQALHGAGTFTLATDNLPAGVYVLRVRYASGTVARRVAVE